MPYDLSDFHRSLPNHQQCVLVDPANEISLHVARWPSRSFESLAAFVRFTFRFSCVLQPFISDPTRDDLDDWFHNDLTADARADELMTRMSTTNQEAHEWMARFYPLISIDWLNAGLHGKIISLLDGAWPEMLGHDTEGYFGVFAADLT